MKQSISNAVAIVGIHTGIGKTVVSAVLAEALGADYWKPIQAGIEETDSVTVAGLISNGVQRVHPEAVVLTMPASPHTAARAEGITIDYKSFSFPATERPLIVETAGGILSPVSDDATVADMVAWFGLPVILVAQNYLGSINHTVMATEVLKTRGIQLLGIVISGDANDASESFIEQYTSEKIIARIPLVQKLNVSNVSAIAKDILAGQKNNIENIFTN